MKRKIALLLALLMIAMSASAVAEMSSRDAINLVIQVINDIGEVDINSGDAITKAEVYYSMLTDSEKMHITNRFKLADAKLQYDKLISSFEDEKAAAIYENAKAAYDKLNQASAICISGMDDVYNAWYFGIYEADDTTSSTVVDQLAKKLTFTETQLNNTINKWGISKYDLTQDWEKCLTLEYFAHYDAGTYTKLQTLLSEAQKILQELTNTYSDYTFYPSLKEYYSVLSSYADFFENPSGSFKQLADTVIDYENKIRTYQTDIGFLFK